MEAVYSVEEPASHAGRTPTRIRKKKTEDISFQIMGFDIER